MPVLWTSILIVPPAWSRLVLRIVPLPHPALRYESKPVTRIDDTLRATIREMFTLMYAARGIGLAANQVSIPFQFFILNLTADPAQPEHEQVFINPEIVKRHASTEHDEGCLSLPGVYAEVHRARKIRVRAFDLEGKSVEVEADDLYGRAIQHETDHLHGRMFIDYLGNSALRPIAKKVREIEQAYRAEQAAGHFPPDDEIRRQLDLMASEGSLEPFGRTILVIPPPPDPSPQDAPDSPI